MMALLLLLLVPLLLLLLRPVWFDTRVQGHARQNLDLYRERSRELESSDLPDDEKSALQIELDREFLSSADEDEGVASGVAGKRQSLILMTTVLMLTGVSTLALYQLWGAANELRVTDLLDKAEQVELTNLERDELMARLQGAVDKHPDNLEWAYLDARLKNAAGLYAEAATAFEAILEQLPEDAAADRAATLTLLAQSRFYAADQQADEQTYAYLRESVELNPQSRMTLGMAGILAFELGKYQQAIDHWRALWTGLPDSPEARSLGDGIRDAAKRVEEETGEAVDLSWMERKELKVLVDISAEARAAVTPETSIFVLARALQGPPMPLAVQRLQVRDLPAVVPLSDAQAMAPGMSISDHSQLVLVARASLAGQPVAASGDWQHTLSPVSNTESELLKLTIDTLVP